MRQPQPSQGYFWPVVWALSIHALLLAFLFVSFASIPELPPSRPVVKATLYQLESQNSATSQTNQKIAGEAEKTRTPNYDQEQLEQKKREQEREAAARRQAEQERKVAAQQAEEQKKAVAQAAAQKAAEEKKAAEQKLAEQKKLELQKAEAARLKAAEEAKAKAEAERKKAEEQKKKAEAERKQAEEKKRAEEQARQKAEAERKKREAEQAAKAAADKAREAERRAQEDRKAAALADLLGDGEPQFQRSVADRQGAQDIGRLDDLIVQLVSENWNRPESARRGMLVELQVEFLPDGTISQVSLVRSSGNSAFDNSAIAAVRNVVRVREIQSLDRAAYERDYRKRKMAFRPEDLSL